MRRRGCLVSFGALALLTLVCCLLLWFVGLPRFQDSIADGISEGLSTEIARQVEQSGVQAEAGTHTISVTNLQRQLRDTIGSQNVEDIGFSAQDGELSLTFGSQGQEFGYSGQPVAENGRMELTNVESTGGGFLDQVFPADKLAGAVESGINAYFEANDLRIVGVTAENDELVIETEEAGR